LLKGNRGWERAIAIPGVDRVEPGRHRGWKEPAPDDNRCDRAQNGRERYENRVRGLNPAA
jgi:hypothetical protein